jgi:fructokinase
LGREGAEGFQAFSPAIVEAGLRFGQALAAWNCGFAGARGGMDHMTVEECLAQVERILAGRIQDAAIFLKTSPQNPSAFWCPKCSEAEESIAVAKRRIMA